ncbi:unnamed protein product [Brassica rapa subsp. narinosa]
MRERAVHTMSMSVTVKVWLQWRLCWHKPIVKRAVTF